LLTQAGLDVDLLADLERRGRPPSGAQTAVWDAHVHLGHDRDGHHLDAHDLIRDLEAAGVQRAVCFPPDDPDPDGSFARANALVAAAAATGPERIVAFCRLDPTSSAWRDDLEHAHAAGACGLKLHPVAQRFSPDAPAALEAVAAATYRRWPVLIHAGFGARGLVAPLVVLLDAVPDARLILAHGARGDARGVREALGSHPGVWFDTSLAVLPDLVDLPPSRLVFGSDRPYGEYGTALDLVDRAARIAGWSPDDVAGVLGANLRMLLSPE
jgi:uncharacterized protein